MGLNIRRIPHHHIKTALGKDLWKLLLPVESQISGYGGIVDQGVADFDIGIEAAEFAAFLGSAQPKGKAGDFEGFLVDIDAEDVVFEDFVLDVGQDQGGVEKLGLEFVHIAVLSHQGFEDLV